MPAFLHIVSGDGPHLLPLESVVEVLPMVHLPHGDGGTADRFCGLLQYRGEVLPTFSLCPADDAPMDHPDWMLVVVRARGWVVRDVVGVVEVDASKVTVPLPGTARPLAVVEVDEQLLPILADVDA